MAQENTVTLGERTFELKEPSTATVLSILNCLGKIGIKAEEAAMAATKSPSSRAVIFGLLSAMTPRDLSNLGIAVLQADPKDRDTVRFIEDHIKVAPVLRAFMINVALSNDLVDAMQAFFDSDQLLSGLTTAIELKLGKVIVPQEQVTSEDLPPSS